MTSFYNVTRQHLDYVHDVIFFYYFVLTEFSENISRNKKVLLYECKRHTTCHVASVWGGGVPTLGYSFPHPDLAGGTYLGAPLP